MIIDILLGILLLQLNIGCGWHLYKSFNEWKMEEKIKEQEKAKRGSLLDSIWENK